MISNLTLKDELAFLSLGSNIHSHFSELYHLETILSNSFQYLYGYYIDKKLVGFIHLSQSFETFDLVTLVVDENWRNKGIASSLLSYVFEKVDGMQRMLLEVRVSNNAAISLYKKYGFKELYVRKKYYGNEDALIMERMF